LCLLTLLLALSVSPLWAQETPALTRTAQLETDNGLTLAVSFPKGWVTTSNEINLFIASSPTALEQLQSGQVTEPDGVGIVLYLPEILDQLNLPRTTPAEETLAAFNEAAGLEGEIQLLPNTLIPVAAGIVTVTDNPDNGGFIAALEFPNGTVIVAAQPSEAVDATVLAILDSITLTGDAPTPTETVPNGEAETATFSIDQQSGSAQLSIDLPAGWLYNYDEDLETIYVGTTENALVQAASATAQFEEGEIAISIGLPALLEQLDISSDADPEAVVQGFIDVTNSRGTVRTDDSFAVPAAHAAVTGQTASTSGDVYSLQFEAGTLLIGVQPPGSVTAAILDTLHSITFGEPVAPVATVEPVGSAEEIRQWASDASGSSQYGESSWSFMQATGEPDTEACGDYSTAWASATSTGRDYLMVEFDQPVIPTQINIHQTYNPGSIVMIDVGNTENRDRVLTLPDSADPLGNTACPGVFSLDVSGVDTPIDFVVIYFDQSITHDWNEIDAVELVGVPAE
ncbi:MAG: hypothetical protein ABI835_13445, partial [Chloroflexota bacterium]